MDFTSFFSWRCKIFRSIMSGAVCKKIEFAKNFTFLENRFHGKKENTIFFLKIDFTKKMFQKTKSHLSFFLR